MKSGIAWGLCLACHIGFFSAADATSIVAKLEEQRVVLAADTRADQLEAASDPSQHSFHDDFCKILPLGPMAAAISGAQDYRRNIPSDPIPDWDALSDSRAAYAAHGDSLPNTARDWAHRAASHYGLFNEVAPQRVMRLASENSEHVIVDAFFVGWSQHIPLLFWEKVYLDENVASSIQIREQILHQLWSRSAGRDPAAPSV